MHDPRRYKARCADQGLDFSGDEERPWPQNRSYDEYMRNAREAERTGKTVNGVKGEQYINASINYYLYKLILCTVYLF